MPRKSRELVWIFEGRFVAWGCKACAWLRPRSHQPESGDSFREVREAFNSHDCKEYRSTKTTPRESLRRRSSSSA